MPPVSLNPQGGRAERVQSRLPDGDVARIAALAARRGVRESALVRELIRQALDQIEGDPDREEPQPLMSG